MTSLTQRLRTLASLRLLHGLQWGSVLLGCVAVWVLGGGYLLLTGDDAASQTITGEIVTVGRSNIVLSIKALGTVTLANEQQLLFNQLGKVAAVHVEEGDEVKRDDLIAELDKSDPLADVRQAQLAVGDAWLKLQDLQASRDQQILSAQNSVRDVERQLEENYGDLPSQEKQVEYAIEQARRTVQEKESALQQSKHTLAASIEDALTDADNLLDDLFGVLSGDRVRGATRYKTFQIDFLFTDYNLKNQTEFAYYDATNAYDDLYDKYGSSIGTITDTSTLSSVLSSAITMAEQIVDLADVSYQFLQTAVPSDDYTDADINTLKSTVNTSRSAAVSLLGTLRTQQATLTTPSQNTAQQALDKAKEDLALLESQLANGTTTADSAERTIANLNDNLRIQQAQLTQTTTSVDVQINQQKNLIAQKNVALEKAQRALEKYELRAPFDGIIRRIDFQVGDNLLADASESKYVVIENPDHLIVTVQLDQVDVVNVKEGQRAFITFDALPDKQFEGQIDIIDTTPIESSGVVSYAVKIDLEPTGDTILSGMTAKVEIQTASVSNALVVPNLALRTTGNRTFVTDENEQQILIETGITDGSYTEVLSGLEEGARIQSVMVNLSSDNATSSQQGMDGPPGGAMGGVMRISGGH
ncbi:MAG: efflux RND transporter periplasmic adaptor subunit [Candidatus Peribacteraceae bacterium]